ncbi:hypothetical protein O9G_000763 [Rozella allomycis CSF55]|uniref:Myb-like domain-containing protein n=1 Tax=Rozella allomycis (strain CSF55) TaxID=988480 RepID=A0A075AR27_ROZAC|nr:hypothetical protein O9G_000763 [Rozella allomycis CSF55]|eukprot:EPZ32688.1 hypothetical protein O9G_000763 [Rozella allomycis CSF55]
MKIRTVKQRASSNIPSELEDMFFSKKISTKDLKELEQKHGIYLRRGAFSSRENAIIEDIARKFAEEKGVLFEDLKDKNVDVGIPELHVEIAKKLKRSYDSVRFHMYQTFVPTFVDKNWTERDTEELKKLYLEQNKTVSEIAKILGKKKSSVKSKVLHLSCPPDSRSNGFWNEDEEQRLKIACEENMNATGLDYPSNWGWIAEQVGTRIYRGRNVGNFYSDEKPVTFRIWTPELCRKLINSIRSHEFDSEQLVNWYQVSRDMNCTLPSVVAKWGTLKKRVFNYRRLDFEELLSEVEKNIC